MKFKPIYIFFIILGLLSVSLVMAAEFEGDLHSHNGYHDPILSGSSMSEHREVSDVHHNIDNDTPENDLTVDALLLTQIR